MTTLALAAAVSLAAAAPADPHAGHAVSQAQNSDPPAGHDAGHEGSQQPGADDRLHGGADHAMPAALGPYPMTREASGTAWQPDSSDHGGVHLAVGAWSLMGHATLNAVYDRQGGPRGGDKGFVSGMVMGMARRDLDAGGALQLRAMLSPDPLMGRRGYPLLLASGETADGVTPLVDRQHPHDLFMELSASASVAIGAKSSLFVYGGLPGEPAFGPPAFMHRASIMDSPEAPISHHWLDSTHIVFGVVTAGLVVDRFKIEASRFRGREPDQQRYDIETGPLDSTAVRLSWNPNRTLALQASFAHQVSAEQLEPEEDVDKWSASAMWTRPLGTGRWWSTTLAWGRRSGEHGGLDAFVLESAVRLRGPWTIFGRAEMTENDELGGMGSGHHGPAYRVGKASLGAVRDWRVAPSTSLGLGALFALNFVPDGLEASYDGDRPGAMVFARLRID